MEASDLNPHRHIKVPLITEAHGDRKLCPSCYRRNGVWVLYSRCPLCGSKGKPIREVVGPTWPDALAEMLRVTETSLGAKSRSGRPQNAVYGPAEAIPEVGP